MTLTGILKNILLVIASVMIWNTTITALQFFGYGLALAGLVYYSLGWEQIVVLTSSVWLYLRTLWEAPTTREDSRLPPAVRKALFVGLCAGVTVLLVFWFAYYGGISVVQLSSRP
jgi:hypothetical protein